MGGCTTSPGRVAATLAALFAILAAIAPAAEQRAGITIIATLFPQYDFARQIADGKADVRLLLPPGAESHSYEPTPSDMKAIDRADLFIYTGPHMEHWAQRLADATDRAGGVTIVDASAGIGYRKNEDGDDHDDHHHDGDHLHEYDPHFWLDPMYAADMAETIADAMAGRDPDNAETYRANAEKLKAELYDLDASFRETVAAASRRQLVFGERFAFAYFFDRYGLEEIGAYKSCAPGAEPGLKAVIEVVDFVKRNNVRYIYREAMATGRISKVINEETGAEVLAVDSLHTLPADKLRQGYTYQSVMRENMDAFAKGLQ